MNYTGSSCENIYNNNPEIGNKTGYYRVDSNIWTYCDMLAFYTGGDYITTCAGVVGG